MSKLKQLFLKLFGKKQNIDWGALANPDFDMSKVEVVTTETLMARWEAEKAKKNFRNWFNGLFPDKGYAGYAPYYLLLHPWEILLYWKQEVEFAWERVFRGWDSRATWAIDYHIAEQIVGTVKYLRKLDWGIPMIMFEGLPFEEGSDWNYTKESEEIAHQRWLQVLDDIVTGFQAYIDNEDRNFYEGNMDEAFTKAFDLFRKHFKNLGW